MLTDRAIAAQPAAAQSSAAEPITRWELMLLAGIIVAGVILRLIALTSGGVEHFDEGVYASNLWCQDLGGAYPDRRFYAPPLLPALIETGMLAGMPPNLAALLPGFLAGSGTILALWWFGRSWFSPRVGVAAAMLAALSDFHIAYSATALTDVLLGLWVLLAVDALARAWLHGNFRWAATAGLFTGLAWWTKYNGWLPLVIGTGALPVLWWLLRPQPKLAVAWLGCLAIAGVVAILVWIPFYLSLRAQGGYGPIAANHAKYVAGLSGWLNSASRHVASQSVMEGLASWLSLSAALVVVALLARADHGSLVRQALWLGIAAVLAFAIAWTGTIFLLLTVAALFGIGTRCLSLRSLQHQDQPLKQAIGLALVSVWWLGLLLTTALYQPYPRLVLPWLIATWLGAALGCDQLVQQPKAKSAGEGEGSQGRSPWRLTFVATLLAASCALTFRLSHIPPRLPSAIGRQQLGQIANQISVTLEKIANANGSVSGPRRAVYVLGEPSLFFQLCAAGESLVVPAKDIPPSATYFGKPIPTYLVVGPHAHRDPQFQQQWATAMDHWQLIQSYDYHPSSIVWLDLNDPRKPVSVTASELNRIEVYRLK